MDWGQFGNSIWLLVIPIFLGLAYRMFQWREKARMKFADSHLIQKLFPNQTSSRYWWKTFLVVLALFFAILALMDPLYGEEEVKIKREGVDVVYALDLSNSMLAEDIAPNRLERAKKLIEESMNRLGGDRVGLIVFAGDAYSISPLTTDYSAIRSYVRSASPYLLSNQGTNFASVLNKAVELFKGAPTTAKLLVILSDGEDNEKNLNSAIQQAKENKINIATIGIGTQNGGPIPMNYDGYEDYKTDRYGEVVITKLEEKTMQTLAENTSGRYFALNQNEETLNGLHQFLNQFNKETQEETFSTDKKHVYQWFLMIALGLIFIDTLTSEHKLFNNKKQ